MGKTKTNRTTKRYKATNRTRKVHMLQNKTPKDIYNLSMRINDDIENKGSVVISSYAPTINEELVSLKSIEREPVFDCNSAAAYRLEEPLKIGIKTGRTRRHIDCLEPDDARVIKHELKALSANKHIDVSKLIPPVQHMSNCWFNTMFMSFFISDKGRKFFHYFRQMMIEGVKSDGSKIPKKLRNAFALLNYAINASMVGLDFAYVLDTNAVIKTIYDSIPNKSKHKYPFIANINQANNPLRYYVSLMTYLKSEDIQLIVYNAEDNNWAKGLTKLVTEEIDFMPHIIMIEIYNIDEDTKINSSKMITNRLRKFGIKGHKYVLDSCIIRDTTNQHFCCTLTCEGKEYAYDGFSYKRIVDMKWKSKINEDYIWGFDAPAEVKSGKPLEWNFRNGYQMLIYYRNN